MPSTTLFFQVLPWDGGLNTSLDDAMISPNQLTVFDNNTFDVRCSRKKREGNQHNWDSGTDNTHSIIGLEDFWYGSSAKTQRIIGVRDDGVVYSYNGGTRTTVTDAGTAYSGTLNTASLLTYGNKCFIAVDGSTNVVKYWDGSGSLANLKNIDNYGNDVTSTYPPPKASVLCEHQGRIFCNDKNNPDMINYCTVGNYQQWSGIGDSGGFPVGSGDGDPTGITCMFSFQGDLFVAKQTKLYRLIGYGPDQMIIKKVSDGIGIVGPNAYAPVDQDDVVFVSERGIHSLGAVNSYGNFSAKFVSSDVQKSFNDAFQKSRLKYTWAAYLSSTNTVAFSFTSKTVSAVDASISAQNYGASAPVTSAKNNEVWLYNLDKKAWNRWPGLSCQALIVANDPDKKRFYFGTHTGRVSKSYIGTNYDLSSAGVRVAIPYRITTGFLFPTNTAYATAMTSESSHYTMKAFKRFILYYRPSGTHTIAVNFTVDNVPLDPSNSMSFSQTASQALLGVNFILGQSLLGYSVEMGPYTRTVDGIGRGCKIEIQQNGIDEDVDIQGFALEWEPSGMSPDSNVPGSS